MILLLLAFFRRTKYLFNCFQRFGRERLGLVGFQNLFHFGIRHILGGEASVPFPFCVRITVEHGGNPGFLAAQRSGTRLVEEQARRVRPSRSNPA